MESRWAPNQIKEFVGMAHVLVLVLPPNGEREKGTSH
jgi:hypothetical protein